MLQPEAHQEQIESYIKMSKRDGDYAGRVICIGLNERHDWIALHEIADWLEMNAGVIAHSYDISSSISVDQLDHYDMSTRPKKGGRSQGAPQAQGCHLCDCPAPVRD